MVLMSRRADNQKGWEKTQEKIAGINRKRRYNFVLATASAAAILLMFFFLYQPDSGNKNDRTAVVSAEPGKNRATLIMSDGRKVDLTDSTNTIVKDASGAKIKIDKGKKIDYKNSATASENPVINTIMIPRSGTFKVVLSDGTQVYINSESSLSYPVAFSGEKRAVTLKGEAFFKVAEDKRHPFVVQCDGNYITVTGTEFNVNSYDAGKTVTTLISGGVLLSNNSGTATLVPGLQGTMTTSGITLLRVDPSVYSSWVDGKFEFDNIELGEMLRILSRWYDVDFEFTDNDISKLTFTASFPKNENLSFIVNLIERISSARFVQEGAKVIVKKEK
jgi:hypothetical protein